MTGIGFGLCGSGFSPRSLDTLIDTFWVDCPNLLEPPITELNPNSPGSTKSTGSLDSFLPRSSDTLSGSTPPLSPWTKDLAERLVSSSCERKDADLHSTINNLWQNDASSHQSPILLHHNPSKKTPLVGADLLQGFEESEGTTPSNGLEEQLASADNAWTAALELPGINFNLSRLPRVIST